MILVIDNFDSFVHNLARYVRQLGFETRVVRNNQIDIETIRHLSPQAILLSPGPCSPDEAGICLEVVRQLSGEFPILGICLGHQAIIQALGGHVVPAIEPMHGRTSQVLHVGSPMFDSVPSPFTAGRYHSLIGNASSLPSTLVATAFTDDRTIMAVEHVELPIVGLQFHPESILTSSGYQLLFNFFQIAKLAPNLMNGSSPESLDAARFAESAADFNRHSRGRPYPISTRLSQTELP